MGKAHSSLLALFLTSFAAFPSSTTLQLYTYNVGANGGTNSAKSSTYSLNGSLGETTAGSTASGTDSANPGSIGEGQLNSPPAPTLSNGSNAYYNKLLCTINNSVDPSNATYSIAVSTNNFVTTNYVSATGTLVGAPVYQSYATWGGAAGTFITGLTSSTTYKVKVDAMEGQFSNTNYGPFASAATAAPSITFSVSPNTITMGSLVANSVVTSSNVTFGLSTNAGSGGAVYVYGLKGGLFSTIQNHTIAAFAGNLSGASEGFGVQVTGVSQTSGGPFTANGSYSGTGNTVGSESTGPTQMLFSNSSLTSGSATAVLKAVTSNSTPNGTDYSETLTFISGANY